MLGRRSFLASLSALLVWWKTPPAYRPYRIDQHTIAVDDAQWGGSFRVSLWDGDHFINVRAR